MVESRQQCAQGGILWPSRCSVAGARGATSQLYHYNTTKDVVQWGKIVGGGNEGISIQQAAGFNVLT